MKVQDLTGADLDYWAAQVDPRCENLHFEWINDADICRYFVGMTKDGDEQIAAIYGSGGGFAVEMKLKRKHKHAECYKPSSFWNQAGPIIERERGSLNPEIQEGMEIIWCARMGEGMNRYQAYGPTPLIAACRAYVASKFGPEVPDVPDVEG